MLIALGTPMTPQALAPTLESSQHANQTQLRSACPSPSNKCLPAQGGSRRSPKSVLHQQTALDLYHAPDSENDMSHCKFGQQNATTTPVAFPGRHLDYTLVRLSSPCLRKPMGCCPPGRLPIRRAAGHAIAAGQAYPLRGAVALRGVGILRQLATSRPPEPHVTTNAPRRCEPKPNPVMQTGVSPERYRSPCGEQEASQDRRNLQLADAHGTVRRRHNWLDTRAGAWHAHVETMQR